MQQKSQKQSIIPAESQTSVTVPQLTLTDEASPESGRSEELSDESASDEDEVSKHASMTAAERLAEKRRMKRFRLTHSQTRFLMSEFSRQPHPDSARRERLSQDIPGLSPRQVQVWFQNRRAKMKRLTGDDQDHVIRSRALPAGFDLSATLRKQRPQQSPSALPHFTGPGTSLLSRNNGSRGSSRHAARPQMSPVDTALARGLSPVSPKPACWSPYASSVSSMNNLTLRSAEVSPQFPSPSMSSMPQSAGSLPSYVYGNSLSYESSNVRSRANSLMTSSPTSPMPASQYFAYNCRRYSDETMPTTYLNTQNGGSFTTRLLPETQHDILGLNHEWASSSYDWRQIPPNQDSPMTSQFHAQASPSIQQQYGNPEWLSPTALSDSSHLGVHNTTEPLQRQQNLQTQAIDGHFSSLASQATRYIHLPEGQPGPQTSLASAPPSAPFTAASQQSPYFTSPLYEAPP